MTGVRGATAGRHLVSVWDPSRGPDAMQSHVQRLLDLRLAERAKRLEDEDVYVWWGKIRSPRRRQTLPHLKDILSLDRLLKGEGPDAEVHLYLTDYRSLYVGHVTEVTEDDVGADPSEREHVPSLYEGATCDCWFRLMDIRRLVLDNTLEVITELRKLRNVRYHDSPVSIYGGMVEPPLIVTRDDGARWFEPRERAVIDGQLWVEFDAERSGLGATERDLRENVLGGETWAGLDPAARSFVATAEKIFRDHRGDPAFDFGPVVVNLAKAVEVQVNDLLRRTLPAVPKAARRVNVDGRTVDLAEFGPLTIGALERILGNERVLAEALGLALRNGTWFVTSLPAILQSLGELRNPAAHSDRLGREDAERLRADLIGIGRLGVFVELARTRPLRG